MFVYNIDRDRLVIYSRCCTNVRMCSVQIHATVMLAVAMQNALTTIVYKHQSIIASRFEGALEELAKLDHRTPLKYSVFHGIIACLCFKSLIVHA